MRPRLFLIDSSPAVQRLVEQASGAEGFEVTAFRQANSAVEAFRRQRPDLVVADYRLEGMAFAAFCERMTGKDGSPGLPIIALLGSSDRLDEKQMHALGVKAVLKKPLQPDDLVDVVRALRITVASETVPVATQEEPAPAPAPTAVHEGEPAASETEPVPEPVEAVRAPETAAIPPAGESLLRFSELATKAGEQSVKNPEGVTKPGGNGGAAEATKGVFAQLLQSVKDSTERSMATRVTELVTQEARLQLPNIVRAELPVLVEATVNSDQIKTLMQDTVGRQLPAIVGERVMAMEPMVQQTVKTLAANLLQELVEKQLKDMVEAALPTAIAESLRQHQEHIERLVKETAELAAHRQAREVAETVVRDVAQEVVRGVFEQAMREMAAGLAVSR